MDDSYQQRKRSQLFYLTDFLLNTKLDLLKNCPIYYPKITDTPRAKSGADPKETVAMYRKQINGRKGKYIY